MANPTVNETVTLVLAIGGNLTWALIFFANSVKRKYAAERDFGHLKTNIKTLTDNLDFLFKELDRRLDNQDTNISEIKTYIINRAIQRRRTDEE